MALTNLQRDKDCDTAQELDGKRNIQVMHPVKRQLWGRKFWIDGYCVSTAGKYGDEEIDRRL